MSSGFAALSWYVGCIVGAFIWLAGSNLTAYLSTPELIAGSIVLGTIAPAYITFIIASCLSMLEYVFFFFFIEYIHSRCIYYYHSS